jgi:hypothetical protein
MNCPNCKSDERVINSPKPEYGAFFCPCNNHGPQYFNTDGSGTQVSSSPTGKVTVTHVFAPHQQRVIDEKSELDHKLGKLTTFIAESPIFSSLDKEEQSRLDWQQRFMSLYSEVLGQRIAAF